MQFRKIYIIFYILVFIISLVSIPCLSLQLQKRYTFPQRKLLLVPSAREFPFISKGIKSFFADMFYIQGVLSAAEQFETQIKQIAWVQDNFGMAISLDPKLTDGYFFGGVIIVIGMGKEDYSQGIEFLKKYRYLDSQNWRIPYWIGLNYFMLGDSLSAAKFYTEASELPGAPIFLKDNLAMLYYRGGRGDLGVMYLEGLIETVSDPRQLEWIKLKLEWLKNILFLQQKADEFANVKKVMPQSLDDLVTHHFITKIPDDPVGKGYYFDVQSGRVESKF